MSSSVTSLGSQHQTYRKRSKAYRGVAMEGFIARWYSKIRSTPSQIADCAAEARRLTEDLPADAKILEVAPGPGTLAVELARVGRFQVTGVDISHTFVEIARARAREAGVTATFVEGNASALPFEDGSFDLVVSQAAFKNFSQPQAAVDEFCRVLRHGGRAVIQDMRRGASDDEIRREVDGMHLGAFQSFMTRRALKGLRRRAYTREDFARFARSSPFADFTVSEQGIGQEVRLFRDRRQTDRDTVGAT